MAKIQTDQNSGINPHHEAGMESFRSLKLLIDIFIKYGLRQDVAKELEKCINDSHYYFKSFYKYELEFQSGKPNLSIICKIIIGKQMLHFQSVKVTVSTML